MKIITKNYIEKEFFKYFYECSDLEIFRTCFCISFAGAGLERCGAPYFSLPLSLETGICVKENNNRKFVLRKSGSTEEYECDFKNTGKTGINSWADDIYRILDKQMGKIKGADILFVNDFENEKFKRPLTAVVAAFALINKKYISYDDCRNELFKSKLSEKYSYMPFAELFGRKDILLYKNKKNEAEYFPLDLFSCRYILITGKYEKENTDSRLEKAYKDTENIDCKKISDLSNDEIYVLNEIKRCNELQYIIKEKDFTRLSGILKKSADEYCRIFKKNGRKFSDMFNLAYDSGYCELTVQAFSSGGICTVVKNENIDEFINYYSSEYEKKAGYSPAFYICDSADSGVCLSDVESE